MNHFNKNYIVLLNRFIKLVESFLLQFANYSVENYSFSSYQ